MDVRKLAVEPTAILHLRDANDELLYEKIADPDRPGKFKGEPDDAPPGDYPGLPVTIELYSPGTKTFGKAQQAKQNLWTDRLKKKGKTDLSADDQRAENATFLAACTKAMSHIQIERLEGEALYKAVYAEVGIGFIAEQAMKHLGEWSNFTNGSTKS